MKVTLRGKYAVVVTVLAVMVTGCGQKSTAPSQSVARAGATISSSSEIYHGAWLQHPYHLPAVSMSSTAGDWRSLAEVISAPGVQVNLVTLGYTSCDDGACDVVVADAMAAVRALEPAQRQRVQVVMVSADPQRDSVVALKRYLGQFVSSASADGGPVLPPVGVRPETDAVVHQVARALGVVVENPAATSPAAAPASAPVSPVAWSAHGDEHTVPPGGYLVTHSTQLVAVTPQGEGVLVWTDQTRTVANLTADLRVYLHRM